MSIVLLTVLAVMWAAFLLPLIAPGQRGPRGARRRDAGGADSDGWRPAPRPGRGDPSRTRDRRRLARRRAVRRRRRVLLALSIAVGVAGRLWYLLDGRWWIA
ncbi:MAG TPA: hypothetical protein VE776_10915, partial [Actinomycetota bacterium]|nr:hypothetical protein [Actinomycetota bacterium]